MGWFLLGFLVFGFWIVVWFFRLVWRRGRIAAEAAWDYREVVALEQPRPVVLLELADLRDPVDRFFDDVMVMAEDETLRNNRLAILGELRALFLDVADISRLSIG